MSYQNYQPTHPQQGIHQFIPNYVTKSDYLPTNRVVEGNSSQTSELLRQYEQEKRRGRVFTQRPAEFNPTRYVSYQTYERVDPNRCLDEQSFSRISRRY